MLCLAAPAQAEESGWSLDLFGRVQADAGDLGVPEGLADAEEGLEGEFRRVRIGAAGDIPGGLGYKVEVDFAGGDVTFTDALLAYEAGGLTLAAGQHNTFQSLEELTSSRFTSFVERAAFTDAFGFERRLGFSAQVESGDALIQLGAFADNVHDIADDRDKGWSLDGRAVYAPKAGETRLHLAGSAHWRALDDGGADSLRYRQRPHFHFTSQRYIDTGSFASSGELGLGLEAAAINGPFHAAAEAFWQTAQRPGLEDPTFFGAYAEVGFFLTGGDSRGYKGFKFDRVKPKRPVGRGGIGALQVNLRYDYLDLVDQGIVGGIHNGYAASLIWTPTSHTRLTLDYGRMEYDQAAVPAGGTSAYGVDTVGMRAQFDF